MQRLMILALLLPVPGLAQDCPPAPDISAEAAPLMRAVAVAPDPGTAQVLTGELWKLWTRAPDARAQDLLDRGMSKRSSYDFDGAQALFDELIGYCPLYAEGWNQRAFVHFLRSDYPMALEDLEQALELSPEHIGARAGQALVLIHLGRVKAGQSALREALKLNPWLPERSYLIPEPEPEGEEL